MNIFWITWKAMEFSQQVLFAPIAMNPVIIAVTDINFTVVLVDTGKLLKLRKECSVDIQLE